MLSFTQLITLSIKKYVSLILARCYENTWGHFLH